MRALVLLSMIGGCTDVRTCKSGTLLVHVTLEGTTAQADQLAVTVSIDGTANGNPPQAHKPGVASGNLEVDFPSGYPRGSGAVVEVVALLAGAELGRQSTPTIVLVAGCTATSLTVGMSGGDLAVPPVLPDLAQQLDFAGANDLLPPLDLAGDMARAIDLAGLDLSGCMPVTEDCFNNKDDDCDGLVDCDDPDCVGGASPTAICVPDPSGFTGGTVAAGTCPNTFPISTSIYQGLSAACSSTSCGGCTTLTSDFGPPDDCYTLVWNWSTNQCNGGSGAQVRATSALCTAITPVPANHWHSIETPAYYDGYCNNPNGSSSKMTPQWSTSKLFCRGNVVGGGCIAGNICVPAATNHCVIKTGASLACPTGYNPQSPYYTGYDDSTRVCTCGCINSVQGTCTGSPLVQVFSNSMCTTGAHTISPATCDNTDLSAYGWAEGSGVTVASHATCAPSGYVSSGSVMTTGEQTVCCMP
jgi:hypothetical protein